MQRIPDEACASICGLFCGACPAFPNECHGCFSDYVREGCPQWIEEKIKEHKCPKCDNLINWFEVNTHSCTTSH